MTCGSKTITDKNNSRPSDCRMKRANQAFGVCSQSDNREVRPYASKVTPENTPNHPSHSLRTATSSLMSYDGITMSEITSLLGRVLCWLGIHDFRVTDTSFGFGAGGNVEKVECRRCGVTETRQA